MKVDTSRSISSLSSQLAVSPKKEKTALPLGATVHAATEERKQTDRPAPEVSNREIRFDNLFVRLKFHSDKETGKTVIQLIDSETGEVVRQIPPEEVLHVMKALRDLKGMLFSTIS